MPVANLADGDVIQCIIETRLNQQRLLNVLHYKCVGTPTNVNYFGGMAALNTDLNKANGLIKGMLDLMSQDASIWSVYSQRVWPTRGPLVELSIVDPGLVAGAAAPQNVTMSITKKVDAAGRGYNGRIQLVGLPLSGITDGLWNAGQIALVSQWAPMLLEALDAGADIDRYYPVTWNRSTGGTNNVRDFEVQEEVRTMHRRTVGLGI